MIYLGNSPVGVAVDAMRVKEIKITSEQETVGGCYDAVQAAVGSHQRWIAWVDDYSYMTGAGGKCVLIVGTPDESYRSAYRNDTQYGYMRRFGTAGASASTSCNIPANTVFKCFIFPES